MKTIEFHGGLPAYPPNWFVHVATRHIRFPAWFSRVYRGVRAWLAASIFSPCGARTPRRFFLLFVSHTHTYVRERRCSDVEDKLIKLVPLVG